MAAPVTKIVTVVTPENPRILALFDVDGTLTIPRGKVTDSMMTFMKDLSKKITVGIVGGSDLPKQEEQLGDGIAHVFPYNFSQNGLVAYKNGELLEVQTISKHLGEDNIKKIVNWVMKYLADIDLPVKVRVCCGIQIQLELIVGLGDVTRFVKSIQYDETRMVVLTQKQKPNCREEPLLNFAVACSIFLPLVVIALVRNVTITKNLIWPKIFAKIWWRLCERNLPISI